MDLHGMKRKDLQTLCKKHGIRANLKNIEMAAKLASLFEKENGTGTKISPDDSVETDGIEDNLVVNKEAKKVTFSPENEVFEFTRSVKIRKRKNVRPRIQARDLQQGGIKLRRSKRNVAKGIVAGSSENESNTRRGLAETEKEFSWPDVKVPRRSKRIGSSGITQDDCKATELIDLEQFEDKDISEGEMQMEIDNQDSFKLEKLRRRSTRLTANLLKSCVGETLLPLVGENVEAVKRDDLELEKAPSPSMQFQRNTSEFLVDGQAQKSDKQPKRTSGNDRENTRLLRSSKRTPVDNMFDQAMSNSPKRCSIIHCEQDGASVDTVKKLNVDDKMQVHARLTMNYSRHDSSKTPEVVEGSLVKKQTDGSLDSLVKSSKKAERRMKRDRSTDPGVNIETASTQSSLKPKQVLYVQAQSLQEKASGFDLEARGSSKKSKTMNQECIKDKLQATVEDLPSSSETKVAEFVMISEYNPDNNGAEEDMENSTAGCMSVAHCVNITPEKLFDEYAKLKPEDAGGSEVEARSTFNQEFVKYKPQGMAEDSSPIFETQVTEPGLISENFLDSTVKDSGDISPRRNTQELNSELMEGEREEKHGQDTISMAATKNDKEEASSPSEFLVERSEVSNSDSQQGVPTDHIVMKDIAPTVIAEEDIETIFISKPELKEHSSVAKLAEAEEIPENSAECRKEIHSSKNVEEVSVEEEIQAANIHGNFSEYTDSNSAEEQSEISKVSCISVGQCVHLKTLDEVKDGSLEKPKQTVSSERGCKLNALELHGWSSTDFAREVNVSECFGKDEMKALSQPILVHKTTSGTLDESAVFTTPERNLMLMELVNENGTMRATDSVTHHNEEAIKSQYAISRSPEQFLDEAGKEEERTAAEFLDESDLLNNTDRCLLLGASSQHVSRNEGDSIVVNLYDESDISTSSARQFSMGDFKGDEIGRNEENCSGELHCKSGTSTSPARRANLGNSVSDGAENSGGTSLDNSAVFTKPERNLMLMELVNENRTMRATDSVTHHSDETVESHYAVSTTPAQFLDEAGKEEEHTAADFLDESDLLNNTSRCLVLGGSSQHVLRNEGESKVVERHDVSDISTSPVREFSTGDFKGDEIRTNEENGVVDLHCKSGSSTSPARSAHFGNSVSDGVENSGGNKAMEGYELFESYGQLMCGKSEPMEAVKTGEKVIAESPDESALPNNPEDSELDEAAKSEENKAVELLVESDVFTIAENQLLLETDEGMKRDNVTAQSQDVSDVFTDGESPYLIRDSKLDVAEKGVRENKVVELLGESNISTKSERHLLSGDPGLDGKRKMKEITLATLEESFPLMFSETRQLSGNCEQHNAGNLEPKEVEFKGEHAFFSRLDIDKSDLSQYQSHHTSSPKVMSKNDSVVLGSLVAPLEFSENTIVDSSGCIASKLSSRNEFHAEQETAGTEFIKKGSLAESSVGLDAIQETSETIGEISSYLQVAGTCSMVSEESVPSTDVQNQINDGMEELAITDNDEAKELTKAKETKKSEKSYEANILLNSSGGSYVSGKTCALAGNEGELLVFSSEVNFKNTCEKNGEDEATGQIATVFEKAIDVTPDESIVQNNRNEKAADMEMITRETTPNPEETLNDYSENKEYMNIDESDTMSETQVRKEPILVCRTQVKPGRHDDMKENALNSKIVQNLNVTAPRKSKRQPLKDLKN